LNILIIAAHPDDEVIGMGATIKKLSKSGNNLELVIVSDKVLTLPMYPNMDQEEKNYLINSIDEFFEISQ